MEQGALNVPTLLQNFDTSENKLRREMEIYGPVKSVRYTTVTVDFIYCIVTRTAAGS